MALSATIAVDVMGGDFGPRVTLPASSRFLRLNPDHRLLLIGDCALIAPFLTRDARLAARAEVLHAPDVVSMGARPAAALRHGQASSMYQAIQAVAEGRAQACVSAGNTGALMAIGRHLLGMCPGIDRPAIISRIPAGAGHCYMLDLGANVDSSARLLVQFAQMGTVLCAALDGKPSPRVGLLNIGQEACKGNELVREANRLLREQRTVNYIGYIEPGAIYQGGADVIVCDGFVGNVALKSMEGAARLIDAAVNDAFRGSLLRRLAGVLVAPLLRPVRRHLDPSLRNGATLLGLQGVLVKSHGAASRHGFECALQQAAAELDGDVLQQLKERLQRLASHPGIASPPSSS